VVHMLEIRNAYTVLFGKPKEGNRRLGRLHIKMDLKQVSCESVDWAPMALCHVLVQCFSTAGPRPGTGPWHQLYWAARSLRKLQYATRFH